MKKFITKDAENILNASSLLINIINDINNTAQDISYSVDMRHDNKISEIQEHFGYLIYCLDMRKEELEDEMRIVLDKAEHIEKINNL